MNKKNKMMPIFFTNVWMGFWTDFTLAPLWPREAASFRAQVWRLQARRGIIEVYFLCSLLRSLGTLSPFMEECFNTSCAGWHLPGSSQAWCWSALLLPHFMRQSVLCLLVLWVSFQSLPSQQFFLWMVSSRPTFCDFSLPKGHVGGCDTRHLTYDLH